MPLCSICGEEIPAGSRTCSVCGTTADDFVPAPAMIEPSAQITEIPEMPAELPPGGRYCPVCVRVYAPGEISDAFCSCGTELLNDIPMMAIVEDLPMAPILDDEVTEVASPAEAALAIAEDPNAPEVKLRTKRPAPGTPCVVLYGPDKLPLQYFPLEKDTMLIGRCDAVAGSFPDIDLDEWFDRTTIRKISRQHALILRSCANKTFSLRPLLGNTGTQLEADMIAPQQDYPLTPGNRIILGGLIRLKFEIA